jgi:hypothetical protein
MTITAQAALGILVFGYAFAMTCLWAGMTP